MVEEQHPEDAEQPVDPDLDGYPPEYPQGAPKPKRRPCDCEQGPPWEEVDAVDAYIAARDAEAAAKREANEQKE